MYTVIRTYSGAPGFADELKKRSKEIEAEITTVSGFIAYYLVKTKDGAIAVTVCETQAGCEESTQRAAKWLRTHMPNLKIAAPQVTSGEMAFKFTNYKASQV